MSDPFSDANNYNAVKTLAGYKIKSGNVGDYVYKDTEYTLALKPAGGGGPSTWTIQDAVPNSATVNTGDTVRWDAGNINTEIALTGGSPLHILTQTCVPSGANRDIQINLQPSNTFGPGTLPAQIDIAGNLTTTQGLTTGEVHASAFVPSTPAAPDTVDGATITEAGTAGYEAKIYKKIIEKGTEGQQTAAPFNQVDLVGYNTGTPGYGFPAQNPNIVWTGSNHQINGLNAIMGYNSDILQAGGGLVTPLSYLGLQAGTVQELPMDWGKRNPGPPTVEDRAYYDPLNLRSLTGQSWSGGTAGLGTYYMMGYNAKSLGSPGILRISVEVEGTWNFAPPANAQANELGVWLGMADATGNYKLSFNGGQPKRLLQNYFSYPIQGFPGATQAVTCSATTYLYTYDKSGTAYDQSWDPDDMIKIWLDVPTPSNAHIFSCAGFRATIEYFPNA